MVHSNANDWQHETTTRIELRMLHAGVRSATELARRANLNRSTVSLKRTGSRTWQLSDLQAIAPVLNTTVSYLIGETDDPEIPDGTDAKQRIVTVPVGPIRHRLSFLGVAPLEVLSGEDLSRDDSTASVPAAVLEQIAELRNVPIAYLTVFDGSEDASRIEALVEFTRTASESGVQRIAARSLGALSEAELRALTRAIRRS